MKKIVVSVLAAFVLFSAIFMGPLFNFWAQMSLSALFLSALSFTFDRDGMKRLFVSYCHPERSEGSPVTSWPNRRSFPFDKLRVRMTLTKNRHVLQIVIYGTASAVVLYLIFYFSHIAAGYIFPFSGAEIESVYALKASAPKWVIALLIIFVIGPGEEIFWRGYLQRNLERVYGLTGAITAAFLYCIVHIASWNLMLLAAAFVCGIFWMFLFRRYNSIWINIVSHVVWDISVFILWPFV